MGFMSFKTQDTQESVYIEETLVKILTPFGVLCENCTTDGYGRFDGIGYFETVADINGFGKNQEKGLELYLKNDRSCQFPKIVTMAYSGTYTALTHRPEQCPNQGLRDD